MRYGNNQGIEKVYDAYGREKGVKLIDSTGTVSETCRYEYGYSTNGQIGFVRDNNLNREAWNEYDYANRPLCLTESEQSGVLLHRTALTYDNREHVSSFAEQIANSAGGNGNYTTAYLYNYDDQMTRATFGSGTTNRVEYGYDGLGRLYTRTARNGGTNRTTTYSYLQSPAPIPGLNTTPTTSLVSGINQTGVSFTYAYDTTTANIVSETRTGGSYAGTVSYEYDSLGQLTRINDPTDTTAGSTGTTWVNKYDLGGNLILVEQYAYTTGALGSKQTEINFGHENPKWKDVLTKYKGISITRDAIGNITYDGTWNYEWEAGRQLKSMVKSDKTITYDYDRNGLRIRKTYNGTATNYTLNGAQITHLTKGTSWMHFYYGADDKPVLVNYNGTLYTYVYDLQGDVIALLNAAGTIVVEYKYDAWGRIIGRTGSLVNSLGYLNPFRYRGYVYDEETGMYYLRSRYYRPVWRRFINADVIIGSIGKFFSHNIFSYCGNNPIIHSDEKGMTWNLSWMMDYRDKLSLKVLGALLGNKILDDKNYSVAKDMYNHFLFGHGRDYTDTQKLSESLSKNEDLFNQICLDYSTYGCSINESHVNFRSGDMHYALGEAEYSANIYENDGITYVDVVLSDTYDFGEIRTLAKGLSLSNIANDVGTFFETFGVGKEYEVAVSFTRSLPCFRIS